MRQNLILDLSLRVDNPSVTCSNVSYLTRQLDRFVVGLVAENGEEISGGVVSVTRLAGPERRRLLFCGWWPAGGYDVLGGQRCTRKQGIRSQRGPKHGFFEHVLDLFPERQDFLLEVRHTIFKRRTSPSF